MSRYRFLCASIVITLGYTSASGQAPDPKSVEFFESKIRPVLVRNCYSCHSADAKKLQGKLHLDSSAGVRTGGTKGPAIVPGKSKESLLIKALRHEGALKMPPTGKLSEAVIADFVKWIDMGAPDPRDGRAAVVAKGPDIEAGRRYWAFRPLGEAIPPTVKNEAWVRTPVDRFIMAKLEEKGLPANAMASREKLVRRAYYDLLGLPPTPAEVMAFLKESDAKPQTAYADLIDRLLASERFGERWGRHWLDLVRYAESGGYEFDKDRPTAHHYRDFVIKAFNQDMPYDEFVRLQIAGDHLKPNDFFATSATGFLVAGPYPGQTTAKTLALIRYNHLDDMVSTLGTSMLGLSLGCARCHDHKYDPIAQQDYYRLVANLARTDSADLKIDLEPEATRKAKAEFDKVHAPFVAARDQFEKEELPKRLAKWLEAQKAKPTTKWSILDTVSAAGKAPLKKLDDGSLLATGKEERSDTYTFIAHTDQRGITALRIDALTDSALPKTGPGRGPDGNFALTEVSLTATPLLGKGKALPVKLRAVKATFEQPGHPLVATLGSDKKIGWSIGGESSQNQSAVFETEGEIGFAGGTVLTLTLKFESDGYGIGRPRLAIATTPRPATLDGEAVAQRIPELRMLLEADKGQITPKNREAVLRWFRALDAETDKVFAAFEQSAKKEPQPKLAALFAATSGKGGDVNFLIRGETDRKGEISKPGFMQVLMKGPEQRWQTATSPSPRVGLAQWLTDAEQGAGHLLARVIVNRLWQHHLGRGIVGTTNDFGVQGEPPTHPELLDFLARELIRNGWKLKPIHKVIMTSAVYMQAGDINETCAQADPLNRLWWRRPAQRLEAEAVRDAILSVSGTLDTTMYGPGTLDPNSARRSVYLTVKRSQMIPLLSIFDTPEAIQSIGERSTTTVATQSLVLMNSPFVRQRAEKLAARVKPKMTESPIKAIEEAYLTALSRQPTPDEIARAVLFLARQTEKYGKNAKAADLALADFCQILLCLNEFIYVD